MEGCGIEGCGIKTIQGVIIRGACGIKNKLTCPFG
jgi:hypothetical protein